MARHGCTGALPSLSAADEIDRIGPFVGALLSVGGRTTIAWKCGLSIINGVGRQLWARVAPTGSGKEIIHPKRGRLIFLISFCNGNNGVWND
jgi:hypothetical protein